MAYRTAQPAAMPSLNAPSALSSEYTPSRTGAASSPSDWNRPAARGGSFIWPEEQSGLAPTRRPAAQAEEEVPASFTSAGAALASQPEEVLRDKLKEYGIDAGAMRGVRALVHALTEHTSLPPSAGRCEPVTVVTTVHPSFRCAMHKFALLGPYPPSALRALDIKLSPAQHFFRCPRQGKGGQCEQTGGLRGGEPHHGFTGRGVEGFPWDWSGR